MKRRGLLKNKRGISTTIEYVLFISLAITMSMIVYVWLKSYIPKEPLECSDGVSILLQSYDYDCNADKLDLSLKNNGRFNIDGYFIKATNKSDQKLAIKDLAKYTSSGSGNNFVTYLDTSGASLSTPGFSRTDIFTLGGTNGLNECSGAGQCIYSLEIIPLKVETINERTRTLSCTSARIRQEISCTATSCMTATESTACTSPKIKCKDPPGECVQCLGESDCSSPLHCKVATNYCVECTQNSQCTTDPAKSVCDTSTNSCVKPQCSDTVDNDGDSKIDYKTDGTGDPGCVDANDDSEVDSPPTSSCNGVWNGISEDAGVVCDTPSTTDQCKDPTDLTSPCICNTGYHADESGNGGCVGDIQTLFYDGFTYGPANPIDNGWTSECIGTCSVDTKTDIYSSIDNPTGDLHEGYYMVTKRTNAAIRSIPTTAHNNIQFSYFRKEHSLPGSKRLIVQWRPDSTSPWTILESVNPSGGESTGWVESSIFDLIGAENKAGIQVRFYTDGGDNDYALWDDIRLTGQVV